MHYSVRSLVLCLPFAALMTGCTIINTDTTHSPVPGTAISGTAFGGSQPVTGANVYLLAANPAGYGSASLSLLTSAATGSTVDSVGAYATTAAVTGGFSLNNDYDCTQGYALGASTSSGATSLAGDEQVYLYIKGGNSGSGTNNSIGLLAALGPCNNIYSNTISANELTTVAAAYAFAGYATDATHLASSGSSLARLGLINAGLNSNNLVSLATGVPVANSTGITRPVATIYTIGDMLAACVNGKSGNTNCSTLFGYTESGGTTGTEPTETATAAINLAHNPWPTAAGMTALYGLVPATGAPYSGGVSSQPNDFTVGLAYTGGALANVTSIAIDGSGSAWVTNFSNNSVSKFSSTGSTLSGNGYATGEGPEGIAIDGSGDAWVPNASGSTSNVFELGSNGAAISPSAGYTGGGLSTPDGVAIDGYGYVWLANNGSADVSKFSSGGSVSSSSTGYTVGGVGEAQGIAIDGSQNVWIANYNSKLAKLANNGTAISPTAGYTGGGLSSPYSIAIDHSGNVWLGNNGNSSNSISEFSSTGTPISSTTGYTGGGLSIPYGVAIDGSGYVWVPNYGSNSITKLSSTGGAISPSTGYTGGAIKTPDCIGLDGSGDVWVAGNATVFELIGAAIPVVTPLAANLANPYSAPASKP